MKKIIEIIIDKQQEANIILAEKNSSKYKANTVPILKFWDSTDSGKWLLVNISIQDFNQIFYKRGWVNIGKS